MAAPPPPPPPPPPGPSSVAKPDNTKLLKSICQGTALKKVPEAAKNDRSGVTIGKPLGSAGTKNNTGILLPPPGKPMLIAEGFASMKNAKKIQTPNPAIIPPNLKRTGIPPPNVVPSNTGAPPPPPPNSSKPINVAQIPPPNRPPLPSSQPVGFQSTPPPPPPPPNKDLKPMFRPPPPICSKPTINNDISTGRVSQPNSFSGPIIPPPPPILPPVSDIKPPKCAPPPPPPFPMGNLSTPVIPPVRSSNNFDSRFTFIDVRNFPGVNCFA